MLPQKAQPGEYKPGQKLYSQPPPPSIYFFSAGFRQVSQVSARFPPGSAGFRRVPLGPAGFRRVRLGSAAPPGSARFRWVPGIRYRSVPPGCAGFCRVSANKVPAPGSPLQFIAKIVPGSCQASANVAAIKEALFVIARTLSKSAYGKITTKMASLVE